MAARRMNPTDVLYGEPIPIRARQRYARFDALAMANAVSAVIFATYLVGAAVAAFAATEVLTTLGQLWFFGIVFQTAMAPSNPIAVAVGAMTMSALAWLMAAAATGLYNATSRG